MDSVETAELPGNDASWYRALLEDADVDVAPVGDQFTDPTPQPSQDALPLIGDPEEPGPHATDIPAWLTAHVEPVPAIGDEPPEDQPPDDQPADDQPLDDQSLDDQPPADDSAGDQRPEDDATHGEPTSEKSAIAVDGNDVELLVADEPPVEEQNLLIDVDPETATEDIEPDVVQPEATGPVPEPEPDREPTPGEKSAEMVGKLWTARTPASPTDVWAPDDMDRQISSSRSFRWSTVVALIAVVGLVVVGLVLLPSITRGRANAYREAIGTALHSLRTELPETQTSLEVATEPDSTITDMSNLSTQLTALSAKASTVDAVGQQPLPSSPPLTSSEPIDELAPIRQRLEPLATTALTIQRRIANLAEYRTLMSGFLVLPELPAEAESSQQADLRVALASAQAESASILADLPDDVSLSDHRATAREINTGFATWQADYLEALRTRDAVTAEMLTTQLISQLRQLDAELVTPLAQIRRQTDADLIDLARSIDEVSALVNGENPVE